MSTQPTPSTAKTSELIVFPMLDAYQCSRCGETLEVPKFAILAGAAKPVRIKGDPLNHLLWFEEQAAKHQACPVRERRSWLDEIRVWRPA